MIMPYTRSGDVAGNRTSHWAVEILVLFLLSCFGYMYILKILVKKEYYFVKLFDDKWHIYIYNIYLPVWYIFLGNVTKGITRMGMNCIL